MVFFNKAHGQLYYKSNCMYKRFNLNLKIGRFIRSFLTFRISRALRSISFYIAFVFVAENFSSGRLFSVEPFNRTPLFCPKTMSPKCLSGNGNRGENFPDKRWVNPLELM